MADAFLFDWLMNRKIIAFLCVMQMEMGFAAVQSDLKYVVHPDSVCQTIDNFGASDAWSMRFLGEWPEEKQRQVADWLFSCENDENGCPKGIGLSLWRFNIGAGSVEQGDSSQINYATRTECFLQKDGTYDWTRQKGQRNFLQLAKERGVTRFLGFLNSPPVYYTQNGLATNTGRGGSFNLKADCYEDYARFLAEVVEGLEAHEGIRLNYVCPVNEPDGHWNWIGPKQEGTPATNREIARIVRCMGKEFQKRQLRTQILVDESSDYRCMMGVYMTGWQRGCSIRSFFSPDSVDTYLGNVPNVPVMMAGHSYWTNTPLSSLRDYRKQLGDTLQKYKVKFWQTETCIMSNDEEIGGGGGYDRTMKTALYVARIIHHDLVCAQASAWQWWRAVGEDYKDGLLRAYSREDNKDGTVVDSKLLWALGNYSRFIRPGAVRLGISSWRGQDWIGEGDTNPEGIMCSAYKNTDGSYVVVAINYSLQDKAFLWEIAGQREKAFKAYRTSDVSNENLAPVVLDQKSPMLKARSITTFVVGDN